MHGIMKVGIALGALAGFAALGSAAMAQEDCSWYALTSAKQQQENESKACNLTGDGWTTDIAVHTTWCESVPPISGARPLPTARRNSTAAAAEFLVVGPGATRIDRLTPSTLPTLSISGRIAPPRYGRSAFCGAKSTPASPCTPRSRAS